MDNLKKRIEKLEKEQPQVVPAPNRTTIKEISVEEWNAVYAPMVQESYDQSMRAKSGSDGAK